MTNQTKSGEAYAFFDCKASKENIEKEIVDIRRVIGTPSKLELSLTEGINPNSFNHPELRAIAQEAKDARIRYVLGAKYNGATNRQTADELSSVLNQAYQSPLYYDKERFVGWIFYEENKHYIERE
jgi:hypothetical protein